MEIKGMFPIVELWAPVVQVLSFTAAWLLGFAIGFIVGKLRNRPVADRQRIA